MRIPPKQNDYPYIWATWLTPFLVGDASCLWSPWYRSNYKGVAKMPSSFDSTKWRIEHTNLLQQIEDRYRKVYPLVRREDQNSFKWRGQSGATIAGKLDLVGVNDYEVRICDAKTGQRREKDVAQMLLYMWAFPYTFPDLAHNRTIIGELIYLDGKQEVYAEDLNDSFKARMKHLMRAIISNTPPDATPSYGECCFCSITPEDCALRVMEPPDEGEMILGDF